MAYEQRDNEGALFKNEDRQKDTHPHAKGKAMIDGVMYWVSAWTKEGTRGRFQSLSFKRMEQQGARTPSSAPPPPKPKPKSDFTDMNDDLGEVPF